MSSITRRRDAANGGVRAKGGGRRKLCCRVVFFFFFFIGPGGTPTTGLCNRERRERYREVREKQNQRDGMRRVDDGMSNAPTPADEPMMDDDRCNEIGRLHRHCLLLYLLMPSLWSPLFFSDAL